METKIAVVKGYTVVYETRDRSFKLLTSDGQEVGSGKTQDEVEAQADKLAKQGYKFPIAAMQAAFQNLQLGRVTSVNLSEKSVYFVTDASRRRCKEKLRYSHLYEATERNLQLANEVATRRSQIEKIEENIRELMGMLENPINLEYFNLPDSY